jgi:hypothetical protein
MTKLKTKMELEVLKVKIAINSQMVEEGVWKKTDSPQMHDYYLNQLNENEQEYLELLREVLVPNKTYTMDMENPIIMYSQEQETIRSIVPFLYEHMIYGEYKDKPYDEDYFYDINTPFAIHKYCVGGETMDDNKAEIIECLYLSHWTFYIDDNGNTIINGRPNDKRNKVNVILNKNIFQTDLIANISLASL